MSNIGRAFSEARKTGVLNLRNNQLTSLPVEIEVEVPELLELNLSDNQLTSLPAEIGKLTKLPELYLRNNQLTSLPAEIGELSNLTELHLRDNQLTSLPAEIGKLTNLTKLDLGYNQLTSVPAEIGKLTNLTGLYLGMNQLTSLPAEIGKLTNLTKLDLRNNQLTSLPAEIGELTNLTKLDLRDNQLDALPRTMVMLPNVQLDGNPLQTIPPSIARSDWGQICLFLATIGEDKPLGDEHVFISYVRDNQSEVDQLVGALKAYGIRVWLDRDDIEPGQRWQTVIRNAIKNGAFFIAVFSEEYNARGTTHMNEELTLAIEQLRKRSQDAQWFIPVLISGEVPDRDIGAGETLQSLQYVDLQQNWADAIRRIVSVIRESRS